MRSSMLAWSGIALGALVCACSEDKAVSSDLDGGAGSSADASGGGRSSSGGAGNSHAGGAAERPDGAPGSGASTSAGGRAASSGGASNSGGKSTGSGGTGSGGKSGSGGASSDTDAGDAGDGGSTGPVEGLPLLGPVKDNQAPIRVANHRLKKFCPGGTEALRSLQLDGAGDVFVECAYGFAKFNPAFALQWSAGFTANDVQGFYAVTAASDGSSFAGGILNTDAVVEKLDATGKVVWRDTWGSSGLESPISIVIAPDGSIYASGSSTGQAPGNPASVAGGHWIARYEANGTRTWLKQYEASIAWSPLLMDSKKTLYTAGCSSMCGGLNSIFQTLDSDGTPLLVVREPVLKSHGFLDSVALAPDERSLYNWTKSGLSNYGLDGSVNWYRDFEGPRMAVLDAVEGTTWTGIVTLNDGQVVTRGDAVYVTGLYANQYQNGSNPPPKTVPAFVARYDLKGDRVWFQEFLFDDGDLYSGVGRVAVDASGNVVVAVDGNNGVAGPYLFKLKGTDGTLMQ